MAKIPHRKLKNSLEFAVFKGHLVWSCHSNQQMNQSRCLWGQHEKKLRSSEHMVFLCDANAQTANSSERGCMLCGLMYNTLHYKCCQRCPWGRYRPHPRHIIIYPRLIMEIHEKIFSATAWHKACIFDIQQCHVELYINPANHAPGVKYGPTPGVIIGPWPC